VAYGIPSPQDRIRLVLPQRAQAITDRGGIASASPWLRGILLVSV
jgi:hypothetical protein